MSDDDTPWAGDWGFCAYCKLLHPLTRDGYLPPHGGEPHYSPYQVCNDPDRLPDMMPKDGIIPSIAAKDTAVQKYIAAVNDRDPREE